MVINYNKPGYTGKKKKTKTGCLLQDMILNKNAYHALLLLSITQVQGKGSKP